MPTSAQVASVRVKRGAKWLDENFPGWESRIKPKTLDLADGKQCICGQVFKGKKRGVSGYAYATVTLFSEANKWINGIVKMQTESQAKSQGLDEDAWFNRAQRVAVALGFDSGSVFEDADDNIVPAAESDMEWVGFTDLQSAWKNLLAKRIPVDN